MLLTGILNENAACFMKHSSLGCLPECYFFAGPHYSLKTLPIWISVPPAPPNKYRSAGWQLSWGDSAAVSTVSEANKHLLQLANAAGVIFVEQSQMTTAAATPRILTFSGRIKCRDVEGKGAGLNLTIYNADGQVLVSESSGGYGDYQMMRQTQGWRDFVLEVVCPAEAVKISLGAILYGSGTAWFSDFEFDLAELRPAAPVKAAEQYIQAAIDTIRRHALYRDSVAWAPLRDTALMITAGSNDPGRQHLAVKYLLQALGDHHSFFMTPEEVASWEGGGLPGVTEIKFPAMKMIEQFGYLQVPGFHSGDEQKIQEFTDSLQRGLTALQKMKPEGWIVDLRENDGGNMEPMLAGLGPIFTGELLGSLVDVNGAGESWYYRNNTYYWEAEAIVSPKNPATLPDGLPIAVLFGPITGSSGEAVLISFIGNPKTRTFGQPSWGLTTGNGPFRPARPRPDDDRINPHGGSHRADLSRQSTTRRSGRY